MLVFQTAKLIKRLLNEIWPGVMTQTIKIIIKKLKQILKILKKTYIEKIINIDKKLIGTIYPKIAIDTMYNIQPNCSIQ